jgi:hypothetical protein
MIQLPAQFDRLLRELKAASTRDQEEFLRSLERALSVKIFAAPNPAPLTGAPLDSAPAAAPALPLATREPIAGEDQRLTQAAKERMLAAMERQGYCVGDKIKTGAMMKELGRKPSDPSLGRAIRQGSRLDLDMIIKAEHWLSQHE